MTFARPAFAEAPHRASVPRPFTWLYPRYGRYTKISIIHDSLCQQPQPPASDRFDADEIFRDGMRDAGVPRPRRWTMWAAVTWATALLFLWRPRGSAR